MLTDRLSKRSTRVMLCRDDTHQGGAHVRVEEIVGLRIRQAREATEMTQEEFGGMLAKYLGKPWPRQAVSAAEKGHRSFAVAELLACSMSLSIGVMDLLRPPAEQYELTFPSGLTVMYEDTGHPDVSPDVEQLRAALVKFVKMANETGRVAAEARAFATWLHDDLDRAIAQLVSKS